MSHLFFDSWSSAFRVFVITACAYISILFILRVSGKRTLSKMNAFDFVITVALGSAFSAVSLNKSIPLLDGVVMFASLVLLQYLITWIAVRSPAIGNLVTNHSTLLYYKGELRKDILKQQRVTMEELRMKMRKEGYADLQEIDMIILEPTGDISFISNLPDGKVTSLEGVEYYPYSSDTD